MDDCVNDTTDEFYVPCIDVFVWHCFVPNRSVGHCMTD
jgi:hypothetical protein